MKTNLILSRALLFFTTLLLLICLSVPSTSTAQIHEPNLDAWLTQHPHIRDTIRWKDSNGTKAYSNWSARQKADLLKMYQKVWNGESLELTDPPPNMIHPADNEDVLTVISKDHAWPLFLAYVAYSLVVEIGEWVPWSLTEYSQEELLELLDGSRMFQWKNGFGGYEPTHRGVPAPPDFIFVEFLNNNNMIAQDRLHTIGNVLDWCRSNMVHFLGGFTAKNMEGHWQYRGSTPISRVISGTVAVFSPYKKGDTSPDIVEHGHHTAGCWGTTAFLRSVLRVVNIPVKETIGGGHSLPYFMSEDKYLSHGDDPYDGLSRNMNHPHPFPVEELFIDQTTYDAWFGPTATSEESAANVSRKPRELAIEYLPRALLTQRCRDIREGNSHADSLVYRWTAFNRNYSVEELEAINLWDRMDAKIKRLDGCATLTSSVPVPTTGTELAIDKPPELTLNNFTIGPGEFAILVHNEQETTVKQENFKTYNSYFTFSKSSGDVDIPNLAQFFQNGGRIELISHITANPLPSHSSEVQFGDIVISEIMWGLDGTSPVKQYIELYNASAHAYSFAGADVSLRFSTVSEEPLPDVAFPPAHTSYLRNKVIDRVSNKGWKVPGRSGNTSENKPLISMYRTIDYTTGDTPDGTLASSWKASTDRVNLPAPSYGTPGARHLPTPVVLVEASQRPPMYWIDAEAGTLHRLINDKMENPVPNVQNATSLAVDATRGTLYWTTKTSEKRGKIHRVNLNGIPNIEGLRDLYGVPLDIAVDPQREKLYWIDALNKIQRADLKVENIRNLVRDLNAPKHITLDVGRGKLYWTEETNDQTSEIRSANLDGSNVQLIKEFTSVPYGLAVDAVNGKLYLTNADGKIQRLNVDGSNFESDLITGLDAPKAVSVDVVGRKIYWTEQDSIHRADLNGENIEDVVTGLGAPTSIIIGNVPAAAPAAPAIAGIPPAATVLLANYPNPFNPETWIPYQLAKASDVKITMYDARGVVVRELDLGHQASGFYTSRSRAAYWDGRNTLGERVASGIYFYQLQADNVSSLRKMLILK